ncbi:MAG: extracellular solute-binding protein [Candidatus Bruticola sp.]
MRWFRLLGLGIVLLLGLLSLTESGCLRRSEQNEPLHLEVWTIALKPKFTVFMQNLFCEFEKNNPNVKVDWVDLPQQNIVQKLMASIAGGVPPDLVNLTTANVLFLAQEMSLAPVSQYLSESEIQEYYPNLWRSSEFLGQVYAVPWYVSVRVLIYNRVLLQEAHLPVDCPPRSREEVARWAAEVKKYCPAKWGCFPVVRLIDDWRMLGLPVYDRRSGSALFEQPTYVASLDWYAELYRQNLLPKEFFIEGYQGALERYKQGNLALLEAGPQLLAQIKADAPQVYAHTDIAPLPWSHEGVVPAALMNFAVPQSSKNKAMAVKLALFLTNWQNQLKFALEVPLLTSSRRSAKSSLFRKSRGDALLDKAIQVSLQQLPKSDDFSLSLPRSRDLERIISRAAEAAIYGEKGSAQALDEAAKQWNQIVEASGYGERKHE